MQITGELLHTAFCDVSGEGRHWQAITDAAKDRYHRMATLLNARLSREPVPQPPGSVAVQLIGDYYAHSASALAQGDPTYEEEQDLLRQLHALQERAEALLKQPTPPVIVCLCGSTRFMQAFAEANLRETIAGHIVLSIGCDTQSDAMLDLAPEVKARLDELHVRKIDLADEILVLNVDGYVGESTAREIAYARRLRKGVRYLVHQGPLSDDGQELTSEEVCFDRLSGERNAEGQGC